MPVKHLSHSSIQLYLWCPRAWKYRYVDKIKRPVSAVLPFGSAMHSAIEDYVRAYTNSTNPVSEIFHDAWHSQLAEEKEIAWKKGESAESLAELGQRMTANEIEVTGGGPSRKVRNLSVFLNDLVPAMDGDEPIIEKKVNLNVPGVEVPIIGYIDMIASDGVPVDFKTASRKWYAKKAHAELQPAFYLSSLIQLGTPSPDQRFRYIIITKTKNPVVQVIETKRTIGELFWTLDLIRETWESIKLGAFNPNSTGWIHSPDYCEFWDICHGVKNV
jgi:CRISPR/Cas system-associated exonuclease Cas4 (RecB family)